MVPEIVGQDGLCEPQITLRAHQLLGIVCRMGGADCPLVDAARAGEIATRLRQDPTVTIRLTSPADQVPHFRTRVVGPQCCADPAELLNRKRDLDVLQKLGLCPGDTRRARYLFSLLFERVTTPDGICAYDTPGWEGCALARSGAYESVRERGWPAMVYQRTEEEKLEFRQRSAERIGREDRIYVRPHHLMCLACWYAGGQGSGPRPDDTLWELLQRIRANPEVLITLVEGPCEVCDCCDGFYPANGRCVHDGGLIRDYKKDLDCFQKLGLMPGATLPARDLVALLFERIPSTRDICGYGDGVVTSREWSICGDPQGNPGYARTRETGLF
jgi:hypothetical protein